MNPNPPDPTIPEYDIVRSDVPARLRGDSEEPVLVECIDSNTGAVVARARVAGLSDRFRDHIGRVWEWASRGNAPDGESLRRGLGMENR